MRPVTINPQNVQASLLALGNASHENDVVEMAQNFTVSNATETLSLDPTTATLSHVAKVLATLLQIHQRGGLNRTT